MKWVKPASMLLLWVAGVIVVSLCFAIMLLHEEWLVAFLIVAIFIYPALRVFMEVVDAMKEAEK